ncbi:MAG: aminotransferase class I/II-fold pyridoxal phosphate-dependent enzyme, partial [Lachnospiraceae bacterium]|nr:aminotransferase class I/II-fold pyridoxal phosphate-dependent enzyme [Lachnospiraceae bacterium]
MISINDNYLRLPESYLFSRIGSRVAEFKREHPEADIIRLGIGDVTQPLIPAVIRALHDAVDEMGMAEGFRGYGPDHGYGFLREIIAEKDFRSRGCDIDPNEIFISDGAKCDCGNIQELFGPDCTVAVCDPVYPVYLDSNVMAGRVKDFDGAAGMWRDVVYLPCTEENGFVPEIPERMPDIIYFCFPNNPTGAVITKEKLQEWV